MLVTKLKYVSIVYNLTEKVIRARGTCKSYNGNEVLVWFPRKSNLHNCFRLFLAIIFKTDAIFETPF